MKKRITFLILLAFTTLSQAQTKITVLSENKTPIIGAKITGYSIADSSQIIKVITDIEGNALILSIKGKIVFKITAFGYENFSDTLKTGKPISINMVKAAFLEEVCVTAQYQPTSIENAVQK